VWPQTVATAATSEWAHTGAFATAAFAPSCTAPAIVRTRSKRRVTLAS